MVDRERCTGASLNPTYFLNMTYSFQELDYLLGLGLRHVSKLILSQRGFPDQYGACLGLEIVLKHRPQEIPRPNEDIKALELCSGVETIPVIRLKSAAV